MTWCHHNFLSGASSNWLSQAFKKCIHLIYELEYLISIFSIMYTVLQCCEESEEFIHWTMKNVYLGMKMTQKGFIFISYWVYSIIVCPLGIFIGLWGAVVIHFNLYILLVFHVSKIVPMWYMQSIHLWTSEWDKKKLSIRMNSDLNFQSDSLSFHVTV